MTTLAHSPAPSTTASAPVRRRRARWLSATGLVAVGTLTLTACGGAPSFEEAWPEAYQKLQEAESVSISLEGTDPATDSTLSSDYSGQLDDSNFSGTVTQGDMELEIRSVNGRTVLQGNDEYFSEQGSDALNEMVGDSWVELDGPGEFGISGLYESLTGGFTGNEAEESGEVEVQEIDEDGTTLYQYSGTEENGEQFSVYLNEDRELVRLESNAQSLEGTAEFSDWNAVEPVELPADEEIVSLPGN